MATIVTRSGKGSPLTNTEVDANFTNLNSDKLELSGGTMTGNLTLSSASSPTITVTDTTNTVTLKVYSQNTESIIGTYSNHNLELFTNSTRALTIDTSQNASFVGNVDATGIIKVGTYDAAQLKVSGYSSSYRSIMLGAIDNNGGTVSLAVDISSIAGSNFAGQNQAYVGKNGLLFPNNAADNWIGGIARGASSDEIHVGPATTGGITTGPLTLTSTDATFAGDITFDGGKQIGLERVSGAEATVGPGWMTVASNANGRFHGEIIVTDSDSSDHGFIRIDWMRSYQDSNFTVFNTGGHNNRITGCRVLSQDSNNTYGTKYLQVYVTVSSPYEVDIYHHHGTDDYNAHTVVTPVIEDTKTGYSLHGEQLEELNTYGFAAEEGIRSGGSVAVGGHITVGDGHTIGDDGSDNLVLTSSAGENLILDSGNSIYLDHDSDSTDSIYLRSGGTAYAYFRTSSDDLLIGPTGEDHDIFFQGNDGGSTINMLKLNASASGDATFSGHIELADSKYLKLGADADFIIYHDGTSNYVQAAKQDSDIIFRGNDGGTGTNMLTLDTSAAGHATFNSGAQFGGPVGIGNASVSGVGLRIQENSTTNVADFRNSNAGGYGLYVGGGSSNGEYALKVADYQLNALFTIIGNGRVGIGTASPGNIVEVAGASPVVEINATSGNPELQFSDGGTDEFSMYYDTGANAFKFVEGGVGTKLTIADGGDATFAGNLDVDGSAGIYQRNSSGGSIVLDDTDTADGSTPMVYLRNTAGQLTLGRANRNASTGRTTGSTDSLTISSAGAATFAGSAAATALTISTSAGKLAFANDADNYYIHHKDSTDGILLSGYYGVSLGHQGNKKLQVDSAGVDITGDVTVSGGQITLGTANTNSAHINSYELMTFNVDTDNDDTDRLFEWNKNGNSGAGTELMRLGEDGHLGLGSGGAVTLNDADIALQVGSGGHSTPTIQIRSGASGTGKLWFGDNSGSAGGRRDGYIEYGQTDSDMRFGTAQVERMRLNGTGLGVGSTNPDGVLDLGNATAGRGIVWGGTTGANNYGGIWSEYGSASIIIGAGLKSPYPTGNAGFRVPYTGTYGYAAIELDSWSDDGMKFYVGPDAAVTKDDVITPTEVMRIATNGRVGIGTTSPSSLLHLASASSPALRIVDTTNDCTLLAYSQNSESIIGTYSTHNLGFFTDSGRTLTLDTSHNATFVGQVTAGTSGTVVLKPTDGSGNTAIEIQAATGEQAYLDLGGADVTDYFARIIADQAGGTGTQFISKNGLVLDPGTGAVHLKYGDTDKLATSSSGVTVTGNATVNEGGEPNASGTLLLQANSSSRQLRIAPPSNAANGYIDYRGGNLLFKDDGTEVARFQGSTSFNLNGKLQLYTTDDQAHYYAFYTHTDDTLRINYDNSGNDEFLMNSSGDLSTTGTITASQSNSDIRLKENIQVISDAVSKVKSLRGVTFNFKESGEAGTGLIAQEVQEVLPEAVYTAPPRNEGDDFLALHYGNTVGLLIEAIKEQQVQIEALTKRLEEVEG